MAPSLAHFPALCLEAIFKRVPLVDLIRSVGLVCKRWYQSRRIELNKRRRLVLADGIGENIENLLEDYYLLTCTYETALIQRVHRADGSPWFTPESPDQIVLNYLAVPGGIRTIPFLASIRNFTRITHLNLFLAHCTNPTLTEVIRLINHFSEHLVELNIQTCHEHQNIGIEEGDDDFDEDDTQELVENLFVCLNHLQSIRHLKFKLSLTDFGNLAIPPEPLACLARLTTFVVRAFGNRLDGWLFDSLNQFAQNVTSIEIKNTDIVTMLQVDQQLSTKFTFLSVTCDDLFYTAEELYDAIGQFCTRFSSLTKLELDSSFDSIPMTVLARYLSLLPQLVHLELQFNDIPPFEGEDELEEEMEEEEEEPNGENENEEQGEQIQPEITQVLSVRLLTLTFESQSHRHTERLFIPEIFPNLQVLKLDDIFSQCQDCEIDAREGIRFYHIHDTEPELARRIAECTRLAREPFRRCANLHTVSLGLNQFSGEQTLIDADEL